MSSQNSSGSQAESLIKKMDNMEENKEIGEGVTLDKVEWNLLWYISNMFSSVLPKPKTFKVSLEASGTCEEIIC